MNLTIHVINLAFETHIDQHRILRSSMRYQGLGFIGGTEIQNNRVYVVSPEQVEHVLDASCIICTSATETALEQLRHSQCDYVVLDGSLSVGQVYEYVSETFQTYNLFESKLQLALASDHIITDYLNVISKTFHAAVLLVDQHFRILGHNTNMDRQEYPIHVYESIQKNYCSIDSLNTIEKHVDYHKYATATEALFTDVPPFERYICVNHLQNGIRKLTLSVHECQNHILRPEWGSIFEDTLNLFARFYKPNIGIFGGQLFRLITALRNRESYIDETLQSEMKRRLWDVDDYYQILYIHLSDDVVEKGLTGMFSNLLLDQHNDSITDVLGNDLIQLLHHGSTMPSKDKFIPSDALVSLLKTWKLSVGASSTFRSLKTMPDYLEYAQYANVYSARQSRVIAFYNDIVIDHFLDQLQANRTDVFALCSPYILRLRQYDQENSTSYLQTMCVYLSNERHLVSSARALYIHRNTLVARLEKINELFGDGNIDDSSTRLHMLLSCILLLRGRST